MITKIFLQDWGLYEAWESPDFAHLTVVHGSNTAGKSTLQDSITMLFGLCEPYHLFKKRKPEEYQRAGETAYLLGWFDNPMLPSGKRRHSQFGAFFTVLCRVDGRDSPITQYKAFDGQVPLQDAITRSKRGEWMRPTDYDAFWKKVGVPKEQRRQRIFKVGDTDKIAASDFAQLHDLFREYCSDPELVEKQENTRKKIRDTERDIDELQEALIRGKRNEKETRDAHSDKVDLKRQFHAREEQRRLLAVAAFIEAERKLKRSTKDSNNDEKERIRIEKELRGLEPILAGFQKERRAADELIKTNAEAAGGLKARLAKAQKGRDAAVVALDELKKGEVRAKQLSKVPDPAVAKHAVNETQAVINEANQELALVLHKIEELTHQADALRDHRMPVSIQLCLADLKKHRVAFELARDHFPRNRPQGFEEAVGRARFGLLVSRKDQARALEIMAKHDYPGPVSTEPPEVFIERATSNLAATEATFTTSLGEYVVIGEIPFLNDKLVRENVKAIERKITEQEKEKTTIERKLEMLASKLEDAGATYRLALERDELTSRLQSLRRAKPENEETVKEYDAILDVWSEKQREMATLEERFKNAGQRIAETESQQRDLKERLEKIQRGPLTELRQDYDSKLAACKEFLEELRDKVDDEETHESRIKTLDRRLKDKAEPTDAEITELKTQLDALEKANAALEEKIKGHKAELALSEAALQRLIEETLAAEEKAFATISKSIAQLGERVGCPARVRREQKGTAWHLVYEVGYRVDAEGRPIWQAIKNSSDSTGEGVKASMVFLMGLSRPEQTLFYVFDEPAKNFSPDNDVEMFKIFQSTSSQVIISTARALDYGDDVDVQQFFLQAQPRTTPNRKALAARHNRYRSPRVPA